MKFLSTKTHGILDYIVGALLIAAPWLFGFYQGGMESWIPIVLGAGTIVYSLITDYEMSVSRNISMKTHLTLDALAGVLLAASPWLFGFSDIVYLPHLIVGLGELLVVLVTQTHPSYEQAYHHH